MAIFEKLNFPPESSIGRIISKENFYSQIKFTKAEKKLFTENIKRIYLENTLNRDSINIDEYKDETREYAEIEVVRIVLNEKKGVQKITEIVNRAISNPVIIVFECSEEYLLALAHKRINLADKSENTTEEILYTDWLSEDSPLWERLDIYRFSFRDFYTFYSGFADETAIFLAEKITDKKTDGETARKILKENERYEKEIESLRSELKKATEFNKKMEINLKIKRLEKEKTEVITNGT